MQQKMRLQFRNPYGQLLRTLHYVVEKPSVSRPHFVFRQRIFRNPELLFLVQDGLVNDSSLIGGRMPSTL